MSRQIKEIFNECIERLRQGDSVENCLMRYPEVASELELLLRTAMNVNWRASMVQPRPEFKYQARYRFINAQYAAAQEEEARSRPTLFSLQRAWVPALGLVLLLIFSSVGTAAAAANSMPDEPLYPVKIATEQVRLTLSISDEAKAELNVKLVETRSQEIIAMVNKGKPEQVAIATARLEQNLDAAETAINKVEESRTKQVTTSSRTDGVFFPPTPLPVKPVPPPPTISSTTSNRTTATAGGQTGDQKLTSQEAEKLRTSLKANISKNLTALQNAEDKAQDKTKEALRRAIEITRNKELKIQQPTRLQNKDTNVVPAHPLPLDTLPKSPFKGIRESDVKPPTTGIKINPLTPPARGSTNIVPDTSKPTTNSGTTTIVK